MAARKLDLYIHVRQLVLDGLERTDFPAEGPSLLRIGACHGHGGFRRAELLECEQHGSAVAELLPTPSPTLRQKFGRSPNKLDTGGRPRRVDCFHRLAFHPRLSQIAQSEQRRAV